MNLTKSQQRIMEEINRKGHCVVSHGYRAGGRKTRRFGSRMADAAIALRDAGLVEFRSVDRHMDCRRDYSDHWTEVVVVKKTENLEFLAPSFLSFPA